MGHLSDLISPTINFLIFLGILYWIFKNVVKRHFAGLQDSVTAIYQRAQDKQRQADEKRVECEKKMQNLPQKETQILQQAEHNADSFENEYQEEVRDKIAKLEQESQMRIKAEESFLVDRLNRQLLEEVLAKTKNSFECDSSLRDKAAEKLMGEISP